MAGTRELNKAEMAHVSGGWEYDGKREWLRGNEISCPYCNNDSREIVVFRASLGASNAAFSCEDCRRSFRYVYHHKHIWRFDDQGRGI